MEKKGLRTPDSSDGRKEKTPARSREGGIEGGPLQGRKRGGEWERLSKGREQQDPLNHQKQRGTNERSLRASFAISGFPRL